MFKVHPGNPRCPKLVTNKGHTFLSGLVVSYVWKVTPCQLLLVVCHDSLIINFIYFKIIVRAKLTVFDFLKLFRVHLAGTKHLTFYDGFKKTRNISATGTFSR